MKSVRFIVPLLNLSVLCISASALDVTYTVTANGNKTPISKYVYGTNGGTGTDYTIRRSGGNRLTAYNWENNFSNAGSDWYYFNDNLLVNNLPWNEQLIPGIAMTTFVDSCLSQGQASIITLQMAGYASADGNHEVNLVTETAPSIRFKQVVSAKGASFCNPPGSPNTSDGYVYMDEFVNFLVSEYGYAGTATGVKFYDLDNEPTLWSSTHREIHPVKPTCVEIRDKSIALATAVKNVDPNAQILGPVLYGFGAYTDFQGALDWGTQGAGYDWFISYYLDKMEAASAEEGKRLLDVLDVHWYPEAYDGAPFTYSNGITQRITNDVATRSMYEARMQAPRTLWDTGYVGYSGENSWVNQWGSSYLPLIPKLKSSINTYYSETKLAFTEYDYGGMSHWSGGIATSDVLGIFGKYGVSIATYWGDGSYVRTAMRMYINYDGSNSTFGDMNVPATMSDKVNSSIYASMFDGDDYEIHLIVVNKNQDNAINGTFTLTSDKNFTAGRVWAFDGNNVNITERTPISNITNNTFTYTLPIVSVSHIVLTAPICPLEYDLTDDCAVDIADLVALVGEPGWSLWLYELQPEESCFGESWCPDINGDLIINFKDFALLAQEWGMQ